MGAENFKFAPKFPPKQNGGWGFSRPKFCILGQKFSDKKKLFEQFSDSPKICGSNCPLPQPLP